jgi:hypothetical protein
MGDKYRDLSTYILLVCTALPHLYSINDITHDIIPLNLGSRLRVMMTDTPNDVIDDMHLFLIMCPGPDLFPCHLYGCQVVGV